MYSLAIDGRNGIEALQGCQLDADLPRLTLQKMCDLRRLAKTNWFSEIPLAEFGTKQAGTALTKYCQYYENNGVHALLSVTNLQKGLGITANMRPAWLRSAQVDSQLTLVLYAKIAGDADCKYVYAICKQYEQMQSQLATVANDLGEEFLSEKAKLIASEQDAFADLLIAKLGIAKSFAEYYRDKWIATTWDQHND